MLTAEEIEAGRSPAGGWTRAQLAQWGVPWPPPKGWKARLQRCQHGRSAAQGGCRACGTTVRRRTAGERVTKGVSAAEIRQARAQMARNKRLVVSGETFRSRYGERGGPITPGSTDTT